MTTQPEPKWPHPLNTRCVRVPPTPRPAIVYPIAVHPFTERVPYHRANTITVRMPSHRARAITVQVATVYQRAAHLDQKAGRLEEAAAHFRKVKRTTVALRRHNI